MRQLLQRGTPMCKAPREIVERGAVLCVDIICELCLKVGKAGMHVRELMLEFGVQPLWRRR